MNVKKHIILIAGSVVMLPGYGMAQEEESAGITYEASTDAFQEHFFGALKEKAIENHDKAVHLLMECKKLQPENPVIDYELGKNYTALKQYDQAETHFKEALAKDPENFWYADALFSLYIDLYDEAEAVRRTAQLVQKYPGYRENLAALYARHQKYEAAIQLLNKADKAPAAIKQQRLRYELLLNAQNKNETLPVQQEEKLNPLEEIQGKIAAYESSGNYKELLTYIDEVLETYPSQSRFYYLKGKALNRLKKHTEAAPVLEVALDFLVDDAELENHIYKELLLAYKALGNTRKTEEYGKKLKNKA